VLEKLEKSSRRVWWHFKNVRLQPNIWFSKFVSLASFNWTSAFKTLASVEIEKKPLIGRILSETSIISMYNMYSTSMLFQQEQNLHFTVWNNLLSLKIPIWMHLRKCMSQIFCTKIFTRQQMNKLCYQLNVKLAEALRYRGMRDNIGRIDFLKILLNCWLIFNEMSALEIW